MRSLGILRSLTYLLVGISLWNVAALPSRGGSAEDWQRMKAITPRNYACGMTPSAPTIDGQIDEAAWQAAPWTEEFVDIEGDRQPRPPLRTRAKMMWDKDFLYIAAELEEPHVWGTIKDHDAVIFQDNDFEVFIDPDGDNHEYYELELNALNTTWDLFLPRPYKDGGGADNRWEFVGMKTAVQVNGTINNPADRDAGWTVEIALPWKSLAKHANRSVPPENGDQWRIDFSRVEWRHEVVEGKYRKIPKTAENNWVWSPQGIIDMHRPERWAFVQFSTEAPGKAKFTSDGSLASRDRLMEVYHRQKSFREKHGRWAKDLKELEIDTATSDAAKSLDLRPTETGYDATIEDKSSEGVRRRWYVREDSRNWMTKPDDVVKSALDRAGKNRTQLEKALAEAPGSQREAVEFLIANMPQRDLETLSAEFLLENTRLSYLAWDESPWKGQIPKSIFFNNVLPYVNINESRDAWRKDFREQFLPLVKDAKTPTAAAAMLNQKLFPLVKVRYSRQRPKADQSPYESIKSGTASCTGLAVLLIDACRAVGVPARFVGTPLWSDNSGNHSWLEVWDQGWHFTGAAEPSGEQLDRAWFVDRASSARRDHELHAIYAVSFQRTPIAFPLVWDRDIDYVHAVNVTDRYVNRGAKPPEGTVRALFCVVDATTRQRCRAAIKVADKSGKVLFEGTTNDERFDGNDHLSAFISTGGPYRVEIRLGERTRTEELRVIHPDTTYTWQLDAAPRDESPATTGQSPKTNAADK